ncbi:MAG: gliding motility protein GldN [Thermoflavifilum aggregans]|nr:gliding motility protein GldN [Thermoflavifilum aggregans]
MKNHVVRIFAIWVLLICWVTTELSAQATRTTTRRRRATTGAVQTQPANNNIVNPATGNVINPPAVDTTRPQATPQRPDNIFGDLENPKTPLRNDNVVVRNLIKDRTPLAYQYIREDDAVWGHRLWEEIDVHEKINLPFAYAGEGGSYDLISILLKAILDSEVVAFNPIDDRFTTPMSIDEVKSELVGKPDTIRVVDPITGKETVQIVQHEFDPHIVTRYRIKEDWVFDKQTSQLYVRILGIAPLKAIYNPDGSLRAMTPLFWLYYPDLRPILARYDVYNPNNYMMRMSWEDVFEMRYFHAFVVKEDNVFDRTIKDYEKNGIRALLEGEKIKNEIFDWEQNLWAY